MLPRLLDVPAAALALLLITGGVLSAQMPDGWEMRLDRPGADASTLTFATMGTGMHATTGPAAIFWNPEHRASGAFRSEVQFTQMKPANHPEAFGLIIGGEDLEGEDQSYLYFLIRQDGRFLIKHRQGSEVHDIKAWTEHSAIRKLGDDGRATNRLAIEVGENGVTFHVNGTQVDAYPRGPMVTDGIVGLRVNHSLDLHIADFGVTAR